MTAVERTLVREWGFFFLGSGGETEEERQNNVNCGFGN